MKVTIREMDLPRLSRAQNMNEREIPRDAGGTLLRAQSEAASVFALLRSPTTNKLAVISFTLANYTPPI